ncbi:hypothetical protein DL93DRAFT_2103675, partial [Clavulina sp. PMI_390]
MPSVKTSAFSDSKYDQDPKALLDAIKATYAGDFTGRHIAIMGLLQIHQAPEERHHSFSGRVGDALLHLKGLLGSSYTLDDFLKEIHMSILLSNTRSSHLIPAVLASPKSVDDVNRQFAQNEGLSDVSAGAAAAAAAASLARREASGSSTGATNASANATASSLGNQAANPVSCLLCDGSHAQSGATSSLWAGRPSRTLPGPPRARGSPGEAMLPRSKTWSQPRLSRRQERQVLIPDPHKLAQLTPGTLIHASAHMSPHRSCFWSYGPSSTLVEVANGQVVKAAGVG